MGHGFIKNISGPPAKYGKEYFDLETWGVLEEAGGGQEGASSVLMDVP